MFHSLTFFPETTGRIFLKYWYIVHIITKFIQATADANFVTLKCLLHFTVLFGNYLDGISYTRASLNLLELAIFKVFDNSTWYLVWTLLRIQVLGFWKKILFIFRRILSEQLSRSWFRIGIDVSSTVYFPMLSCHVMIAYPPWRSDFYS